MDMFVTIVVGLLIVAVPFLLVLPGCALGETCIKKLKYFEPCVGIATACFFVNKI